MYDRVQISEEGWISFVDNGGPYPTNAAIPDSSPPQAMIAAFWDDLTPEVAFNLFEVERNTELGFFRVRSPRMRKIGSPGSIFNFEVFLFPSGEIWVQYLTDTFSAQDKMSATVGNENPAGDDGLQCLYDGTATDGFAVGEGVALRFYPPEGLDPGLAQAIACPGSITSPGPGAPMPEQAVWYGCGGPYYRAQEVLFEFTLATTSEMEASISGFGGRALDLFLLGEARERACICGGSDAIRAGYLEPGMYYLAVDGLTTADEGPFNLDLQCTPLESLSCGEISKPGRTSGCNLLEDYGGTVRELYGPEKVYEVTLPRSARVTATLESTEDLDLILLKDGYMFPWAALSWGDRFMDYDDAVAGLYYLVVDGLRGAKGDLEISLYCDDKLECSGAIPELSCEAPASGDTTGQASVINSYSCSKEIFDGPEVVYSLINPKHQRIDMTLAGAPGQSLFLLSSSDQRDCIGTSSGVLELDGVPAGRYFVVVDGVGGASGPHTISLSLPVCPVSGIDLTPVTVQATVDAQECNPSWVEGTMTVRVANDGPDDLAADFAVAVFEDWDFDGVYTPAADPILGATTVSGGLVAAGDIDVDVPFQGYTLFPGNALWAAVDPENTIPEDLESNNALATSNDCRRMDPVGNWNMNVEWHQPRDAPWEFAVAHLNDDDGDGSVGPGDIPDIVYVEPFTDRIAALWGDTGQLRWEYTSPQPTEVGNLAVGDLDQDGCPEVIASYSTSGGNASGFIVLDGDGNFLWESEAVPQVKYGKGVTGGPPLLADMEHDGDVNVIQGASVFDSQGRLLWLEQRLTPPFAVADIVLGEGSSLWGLTAPSIRTDASSGRT